MHGYIGNTDFDWYRFLYERGKLAEVNFWQPGGGRPIRTVKAFAPFFFKLKKPYNAIAGFGYLTQFSRLPAWLAWEAFKEGNGASEASTMFARIKKYRQKDRHKPTANLEIGCLMIQDPVFFPQSDWIPQPVDWAPNIVQGKTYDLELGEGRRVWEACQARAVGRSQPWLVSEPVIPSGWTTTETRRRLGQGTFKICVMDAYERACAVTGEHSLPVLEAAHIQAYSQAGPHEISNGIALRVDIHRLFDRGYVTIDEDYRFVVSNRLKEDFDNGAEYYKRHGQQIRLPGAAVLRPADERLAWHRERVFVG